MKRILQLVVVVLVTVLFSGCLMTPHYHTGETLAPKKISLITAVNNLVMGSRYDEIEINNEINFGFHLGLRYGLPYRLEAGLHVMLPRLIEGRLRWQINPRSFEYFDVSIDGTYGGMLSNIEYIKYGFTISKEIGPVTPYAYYCQNDMQLARTSDGLEGLIDNFVQHAFDISSDTGFGFEVKLPHGATLCPELNYQIYNEHFEEGIFSIGIALKHDL